MRHFLKKFLRVPYTIDMVLSVIGWAILCAGFGYFLILSQADFEATGTRTIFIFTFPLYSIIVAFFVSIEYGILRFFGIKEKRRELRILNDNIKNGHLLPNLSTGTLKEIFYFLIERPRDWLRASEYGALIIFLTLLTEWLASGETINLSIILISGLISVFLLVMFSTFFAERSIFSVLEECRALLLKRGEKIREPQSKFNSFRTKFTFFLTVPIIVVLVILSFIAHLDLEIAIFALIGLIMAITISKVLSFSVYQAFLGIRNFAKELPTSRRALFSTGSLDKEIVDLSEGLNKAAEEVYVARRELEEAKTILKVKVKARTRELNELAENLEEQVEERTKEIQERVKELEKFHKLTVGRELKMIELKKEVKKLKEEIEKRK